MHSLKKRGSCVAILCNALKSSSFSLCIYLQINHSNTNAIGKLSSKWCPLFSHGLTHTTKQSRWQAIYRAQVLESVDPWMQEYNQRAFQYADNYRRPHLIRVYWVGRKERLHVCWACLGQAKWPPLWAWSPACSCVALRCRIWPYVSFYSATGLIGRRD